MKVDLRAYKPQRSLSELVRRGIWQGFTSIFVQRLPRPFNFLRIPLLRLSGARIGKKCLLMPGLKVLMPWQLVLADYVAFGRDVEVYNHGTVTVGTMSVISQYSFLCTSSHDYTLSYMPLTFKEITVGSECWIAAGVFVGPGVSIGNGCIIGAKSVVSRSMPEWMVCVGNPCKPIKQRTITDQPSD